MANFQARWWLAAIAMLIAASSSATAQNFQPFGPTGIDTDWEWFAPAELGDFGDVPEPNEGYFFKYERLNWNITNPPSNDHPYEGEWVWGNRFDIGYMSDGRGWSGSIFRILGPNIDDRPQGALEVNNYSSSIGGGEVMRTWQLKQFHRGSYFEPMLGIRYLQFNQDVTFDSTSVIVHADVENAIIGPQVGFRWFRQNQRWLVAAEGRFFAGFNHQKYNFVDEYTFVPTGEIRLQATYELFRHVAIAFGYTGLFLTDGVGQEGLDQINGVFFTDRTTSSHLFMNGINFGFVINR